MARPVPVPNKLFVFCLFLVGRVKPVKFEHCQKTSLPVADSARVAKNTGGNDEQKAAKSAKMGCFHNSALTRVAIKDVFRCAMVCTLP
jgi:hypothetical protein